MSTACRTPGCTQPALYPEEYCCPPCQASHGFAHSDRCRFAGADPGVAYQKHSDTSRESAGQFQEDARTMNEKVWAYLMGCAWEGSTGRAVAEFFDGQISSWHPRLLALEEQGRAVCLERKRVNPASGRRAHIWVATEFMRPEDTVAVRPNDEEERCPHCGGEL